MSVSIPIASTAKNFQPGRSPKYITPGLSIEETEIMGCGTERIYFKVEQYAGVLECTCNNWCRQLYSRL